MWKSFWMVYAASLYQSLRCIIVKRKHQKIVSSIAATERSASDVLKAIIRIKIQTNKNNERSILFGGIMSNTLLHKGALWWDSRELVVFTCSVISWFVLQTLLDEYHGVVIFELICSNTSWRPWNVRQRRASGALDHDFSAWFEPAHEIMVLFVFRKLILQTHMRNHPVGLYVWFLVGQFVYFYTSCVRTAKALARLMHRLA